MSASEHAERALRKWRGGGNIGDTQLDNIVREACRDAMLEEREECCKILGSDEPNTRAEKILERLYQLGAQGDLSDEVCELLSKLCEVDADQLGDMQANIRARGEP